MSMRRSDKTTAVLTVSVDNARDEVFYTSFSPSPTPQAVPVTDALPGHNLFVTPGQLAPIAATVPSNLATDGERAGTTGAPSSPIDPPLQPEPSDCQSRTINHDPSPSLWHLANTAIPDEEAGLPSSHGTTSATVLREKRRMRGSSGTIAGHRDGTKYGDTHMQATLGHEQGGHATSPDTHGQGRHTDAETWSIGLDVQPPPHQPSQSLLQPHLYTQPPPQPQVDILLPAGAQHEKRATSPKRTRAKRKADIFW